MAIGTRRHILRKGDNIVMVQVDASLKVSEIVGDDCPMKLEQPWLLARTMASSAGWEVLPNQWEAKNIKVVEEPDLSGSGTCFRISVSATHPLAGNLKVTVSAKDLPNAKAAFWSKWTGVARATGAHTHLEHGGYVRG